MTEVAPQHSEPNAAARRIMALDILRGYFIIIIASIHLEYYPSLLGSFDGRGLLWVSEADGFFFISGLLIGIIRKRDLIRGGFLLAWRRLWRRSLSLYLAGTILSLLYVVVARFTAAHGIPGAKPGYETGSWWHILTSIFSLNYSYGWTDFLVYYTLYMFVAPLVIWLLHRRLWWVVLIGSYAIYYLHWSGHLPDARYQWQAPFFIGTVIGYHWNELIAYYRHFTVAARRQIAAATVAVTAALYLLALTYVFTPIFFMRRPVPGGQAGDLVRAIIAQSQNKIYDLMLVDGRNGLLRPIILVITMAGLLIIVRRFEDAILRRAGWLLMPFGQNSLYVYITESILLFAVPYFFDVGPFWRNSLIELVIVTLIWFALRRRLLFRLIPR